MILTHWGRDKIDAILQTTSLNVNFLNENVWIPIEMSLKFVLKGPINDISALVQKMAWRRPGDKPLSEPMMVTLLTHICVTRPQWARMIKFKDVYLRHLWPTSPLWSDAIASPLTNDNTPDSKVHGAIMGPIWDRQHPGGPHVGPMNLAIWDQ